MGLFRKIRSLFRRSKPTNNTAIIQNDKHIRAYNELSAKEKINVANEIDALVSFDFSDIVAYTKDQDDRINYIQNYIINARNELINDKDKITKLAKTINALLIYAGECEILKNELEQIKKELEIKYYALNTILENPRKTLGNRDEIQWYKKQLNHLIEERRVISNSINNVFFAIKSIDDRIVNSLLQEDQSQSLIINNELYQRTLDILVDEISDLWYYRKSFFTEVLEKVINKINGFNNRFSRDLSDKIQDYLTENDPDFMKRIKSIDLLKPNSRPYKMCLIKFLAKKNDSDAWKYLVSELPDPLLKELYNIVAKYMHEKRIESFNHRDDYKIYLKEVEDLTNRCFSTPVENWRSSNISPYSSMLQFSGNGIQYSHMCRNYLTDEIREQMRTAFAKLNWLSNVAGYLTGVDPGYYLDESGANLYGEKAVIEYFNRFDDELLTKVEEKYGIKLSELKFLRKDKNYRKNIRSNHRSLIALLNEAYTFYVKIHCSKDSSTSGCDIRTIDEVYYHLKTMGFDIEKIDFGKEDTFYSDAYFSMDQLSDFDKFAATIRIKQLESQYDERILISPNLSVYLNDWWQRLILTSENKYIAAIPCDCCMLEDILCGGAIRKRFKYLFVKEITVKTLQEAVDNYLSVDNPQGISKYDDFYKKLKENGVVRVDGETLSAINFINIYFTYFNNNDHIDYHDLKIVIIPDDTTYSELSNLLNQELEKEKDEISIKKN